MGVAGKHVLARAGFAQNKHGRVRVRKAAQQGNHVAHGPAGIHRFARFCRALRNVGQLVVDLVNKLALPGHLGLQLGEQGDIARKRDHQTQIPPGIKNGKARKHKLFTVFELLHMGGGPARAHDRRVQDAIKRAFLYQIAHILAAYLFLGQPGQLLVHAVDPQAGARGVAYKNAFRQGVEYALHMF